VTQLPIDSLQVKDIVCDLLRRESRFLIQSEQSSDFSAVLSCCHYALQMVNELPNEVIAHIFDAVRGNYCQMLETHNVVNFRPPQTTLLDNLHLFRKLHARDLT